MCVFSIIETGIFPSFIVSLVLVSANAALGYKQTTKSTKNYKVNRSLQAVLYNDKNRQNPVVFLTLANSKLPIVI